MLNRVWFWLLLIGIVYGFGKGTINSVRQASRDQPVAESELGTESDVESPSAESPDAESPPAATLPEIGKQLNAAALDAARLSVEICIGLIGIMALWLGLLRVAEDAGLVASLARLLQPIMRWLFPDVPDGHPAQGAMLMNISANMLGLDNAATPMGLKAMQELQKLNPTEDTATDAMATFLALNTSSVTLIPFTVIGYRAVAGSSNPTGPLAAMVLVTSVSTFVAIVAARWLSRRKRYALKIEPMDATSQEN